MPFTFQDASLISISAKFPTLPNHLTLASNAQALAYKRARLKKRQGLIAASQTIIITDLVILAQTNMTLMQNLVGQTIALASPSLQNKAWQANPV